MKRWHWVLAPILLGLSSFVASLPHPKAPAARVAQLGLVALPILVTLGLANPIRFRWAFRLVAAALVVASVASFGVFSTPDAALVLLLVGLPSLQYLVSGQSGTLFDAIAASPRDGGER